MTIVASVGCSVRGYYSSDIGVDYEIYAHVITLVLFHLG